MYNLFRKRVENMNNYYDIGEKLKQAWKEKGYSARELAKLCDISHTEISNIEKGKRVKPAILTLKGFEKYLDLDFKEMVQAVGYAPETIKYGDNNVIVSFERYDKKVREFESKISELEKTVLFKKHLGVDKIILWLSIWLSKISKQCRWKTYEKSRIHICIIK